MEGAGGWRRVRGAIPLSWGVCKPGEWYRLVCLSSASGKESTEREILRRRSTAPFISRQAKPSSPPRVQTKNHVSSNPSELRCAIISKKAREYDLTWASGQKNAR